MEPEPLGPGALRVLYVICRLYQGQRRPTIRAVAADAGFTSLSTVTHHIDTLERLGFVTREPGRSATLRPLVRVVAVA